VRGSLEERLLEYRQRGRRAARQREFLREALRAVLDEPERAVEIAEEALEAVRRVR
jgi:hypothetical protein